MFNEYIIFLLFLIVFLILNSLFNNKYYITLFVNLEAAWMVFFLYNMYLNEFLDNPILYYINIWILIFSTCEVVLLLVLIAFFKYK